MIQYETIESSFFLANKKYCEVIESRLKTLNLECTGSCNCYGYEVLSTMMRDHVTYKLKFIKTQTPDRYGAIDYTGVEVTVTGLDKKIRLSFGRSLLQRLLCSPEIRMKIPKPYYIKYIDSSDSIFMYYLIERILDNNISKIKLKDGTLKLKINEPVADPLKLIRDIELMTKKWA